MKKVNGYWQLVRLSVWILFYNINNENNSFSITIPGHWQTKSDEKTNNDSEKLLELRSLELHVKEVRKRGNKIKIGDNEYKLSDFDTE